MSPARHRTLLSGGAGGTGGSGRFGAWSSTRRIAAGAAAALGLALVLTVAVVYSGSDAAPQAHRRSPAPVAGSRSAPATATAPPPSTSPAAASSSDAASSTRRPGALPPIPGGIVGPAHSGSDVAFAGSPPVKLRIPAIHVTSALQRLGLAKDGTLQSPTKWQVAGWYAGGVSPGDIGPALIAGHIDSTKGPAIFYRLRDLHDGASVYVTRADGSTVRFVVAGHAQYSKKHFPTEAVYGPTTQATLRLVTCTGEFDAAHHNYLDNLVVTAYAA